MNAVDTIKELDHNWVQNYFNTDQKAFASYLHDDFIYTSNEFVFQKNEYLKHVALGKISVSAFDEEDIEITDFGYTALCKARVKNNTSKSDSQHKEFTLVWHFSGDEWKAIALYDNE